MKRIFAGIYLTMIIILLLWIANLDAQTILLSKGSVFKQGIYYDNNSTLNRIYNHPLREVQWDRWADEGYLGKRGTWYYVRFPEYEFWNSKVICYVVQDTTLEWFNGKKNFGWDKNDTVEPIEVHYREYRFRLKNGNVIEKQKGVSLKNNSNGHQDLKDIVYNGLKGMTVAFENRVKPKPRIK